MHLPGDPPIGLSSAAHPQPLAHMQSKAEVMLEHSEQVWPYRVRPPAAQPSQAAWHFCPTESQPHSSCEEHSPQLVKREQADWQGSAEIWMPEVCVQLCSIGTS